MLMDSQSLLDKGQDMSFMSIRMATIEDVAIITHHRNAMFKDMGHGTDQSRVEMDKHFTDWFHRHFTDGSYLGWLACDGDDVVAGLGLWLMDWVSPVSGYDGRLPYILNVYTEPTYRKQGIAKRLVNDCIAYCRAEGYEQIRLHYSDAGRPIYEKLGFIQNNEMVLRLK
ncbi:MAG: GNAT family N-acetyltransferase [Chloroflexota bacterium]